jgi:hypothetical protein
MSNNKPIRITVANVKAARAAFEENEPRDLFYRAASELVALVRRGSTSLTLAEALAVLLPTWNKAYYQYRPFDAHHFGAIEALLTAYRKLLDRYRDMPIEKVSQDDKKRIVELFEAFEGVLGPVGAAKALHLLAPLTVSALGPLACRGLWPTTWPSWIERRPLLELHARLSESGPRFESSWIRGQWAKGDRRVQLW